MLECLSLCHTMEASRDAGVVTAWAPTSLLYSSLPLVQDEIRDDERTVYNSKDANSTVLLPAGRGQNHPSKFKDGWLVNL